jgi:hypothetical protein
VSTKSILEIDVQAQSFDRYLQLFNKYEAQAAKQPALWKALGYTHIANANAFTKMTSAVQAQARVQKEIGDVYKSQNRSLMQGERLWGSMATHAKGIASSIVSATRSMLSWTGVIGAVGGLLGAGGLWGIDRMARSVSSDRRSSMGLGLSIGEQKAFQINFGRAVDPDSFLSWVAQMESDPRKGAYAGGIGVGLTGKTGADAVSMLDAIRSRALATDPRMRGMLPEMMHWEGVSGEDVRRLAGMSNEEYAGLKSGYGKDASRLNIPDKTAEAWANFIKRLDEAKESIFKTFVVGLAPLAGPLGHLSAEFVKFTDVLMKSGLVRDAINGLANGLDVFAGKIGSGEFQKSVEGFLSAVDEMAQKLRHPFEAAGSWLADELMKGTHPDKYYEYASQGERSEYLGALDKKYGLPKGTTERVWGAESNKSWDPKDSAKGAVGPFQFKPVTAAAYRVDPHSWSDSAYGAAHYLSDLRDRYKGDMQKALAAYNWGPANVDWDIKQHSKDWQGYLPAETRGYVAATSAGNIAVTVNISTPPGSDFTATASAVAH